MSKTIAIIQSNYLPWIGYFDIIARTDALILLDCVQSTKNDWRNRNRIKTPNGAQWLTIPTHHSLQRRINEVEVASTSWTKKHLQSIQQNYARATCFKQYQPELQEQFARSKEETRLSKINVQWLTWMCQQLQIDTPFVNAEDLLPVTMLDKLNPTARLVSLCQAYSATSYLSGPAALAYMDLRQFDDVDISVEIMSYEHYPSYQQLHGEFLSHMSAVDLLLNLGDQAGSYLLDAGTRHVTLPAVHAG